MAATTSSRAPESAEASRTPVVGALLVLEPVNLLGCRSLAGQSDEVGLYIFFLLVLSGGGSLR
jgi:hypothetical protein